MIATGKPRKRLQYTKRHVREWHQVTLIGLEPFWRNRPKPFAEIKLTPLRIGGLTKPCPGQRKKLIHRAVGVCESLTRPPECAQLVITENSFTMLFLPYQF